MSLSKQQIAEAKERYSRWFWIYERDLLECAKRYPAWRVLAHELGFTDTKIDGEWKFTDAGRHIKYAEIPSWRDRVE